MPGTTNSLISPEGTDELDSQINWATPVFQPSLRDYTSLDLDPVLERVQTPGYFRLSIRDRRLHLFKKLLNVLPIC
jgi:hypothetical protein